MNNTINKLSGKVPCVDYTCIGYFHCMFSLRYPYGNIDSSPTMLCSVTNQGLLGMISRLNP